MRKSGHVILFGVLMLAGHVICPRGDRRKNRGKTYIAFISILVVLYLFIANLNCCHEKRTLHLSPVIM